MEEKQVYKVVRPLKVGRTILPFGTLLFKGDFHEEAKAIEWFDMTYEITDPSHDGLSYFSIDESCIELATDEDQILVDRFLSGTPQERLEIKKSFIKEVFEDTIHSLYAIDVADDSHSQSMLDNAINGCKLIYKETYGIKFKE